MAGTALGELRQMSRAWLCWWEPGITAAIAQFAALQAVARLPYVSSSCHSISVTERISSERSHRLRSPNDGMIVTSGPLAAVYRKTIIATAARHKLPAVYVSRFTALDGGADFLRARFRRPISARPTAVDRILKGENARWTYLCRRPRNTSW